MIFFLIKSLFLKTSILTKELIGPLTRLETSARERPLTLIPSTATIISPTFNSANCAGVFSITLIIRILPDSLTIFTPIPEIFEVIELF